jgi:hypothetical protein
MEKATLHIKGKVAEVMENNGKLYAKVVCDTDKLLISLENIEDLELGGDVTIEGELKIKSIQFEELGRNNET